MDLKTICITLILFSRYARCNSKIVHVSEGKVVQLNFNYPCNSTRVTLQYSYRPPFYSSANPELISLAENQKLINQNESQSDTCSVHLTIDPVLRDDEGTYILTAYKDGQMLPDYRRIGLQVNYPPGKASCESSNDYDDGEWVSLHCTAPVGNIAGHIICYQNDMRLPSLTKPTESGELLSQVILVRFKAEPVHCCASISDIYTNSSECRDCAWDPIQNIVLTNLQDTSPTSPTTLSSIQDRTPLKDSLDPTLSSNLQNVKTEQPNEKEMSSTKSLHWQYIAIGTLIMMITILTVLYLKNKKENKDLLKKLDSMSKCCVNEQEKLYHLHEKVYIK